MLSARALTIEQFFKLGVFAPASVQRDYVWDGRHSENLFNDIDRACERLTKEPDDRGETRVSVAEEDSSAEPEAPNTLTAGAPFQSEPTPGYHLGGVVLLRPKDGAFEIFDGLQRATTLTILLCLIRDLTASAALKKRLAAMIRSGAAQRLTIPGPDKTLADEIQAEGESLRNFRRAVSARGQRVRVSRNHFHGYLRNWDQERLSRFGTFLLEQTLLVVTETNNRALARQAFITANDRGLVLKPIEIFKGQLLDIADNEAAANQVESRWQEILQIAGAELETFMQAVDFIERRDLQGPDHLARLADYIAKTYGAVRLPQVMDEIKNHALAWEELGKKLKQASDPIADLDIWRLRFFKWFEWRPLALAWYKEYCDNRERTSGGAKTKAENAFKRRFAALHRVCMIMTLAKFSASDRAKIFGNALSQWRGRRDPFSTRGQRPGALTFRPRQVARVAESLVTPIYDEETRLSLLRWIEAGYAETSPHPDLAFASVEHVLPQRPDAASQWIRDFPQEEPRFTACHSIGNLAIMDYLANIKITNKDFQLKRAVIEEQAKKYRTLADIAAKQRWTADAIRERADMMNARVWKQLNIPPPRRA